MATFIDIKFPFGRSDTALPAATTDNDLIKESLIQIIMTQRGERVMHEDFGCDALALVFENNDTALSTRLKADILTAITKWEPRVMVRSVDVVQNENDILITITYVVISTRQLQRLQLTIPTTTTG